MTQWRCPYSQTIVNEKNSFFCLLQDARIGVALMKQRKVKTGCKHQTGIVTAAVDLFIYSDSVITNQQINLLQQVMDE